MIFFFFLVSLSLVHLAQSHTHVFTYLPFRSFYLQIFNVVCHLLLSWLIPSVLFPLTFSLVLFFFSLHLATSRGSGGHRLALPRAAPLGTVLVLVVWATTNIFPRKPSWNVSCWFFSTPLLTCEIVCGVWRIYRYRFLCFRERKWVRERKRESEWKRQRERISRLMAYVVWIFHNTCVAIDNNQDHKQCHKLIQCMKCYLYFQK